MGSAARSAVGRPASAAVAAAAIAEEAPSSTEYPATRAVERFDQDNVRIRLGNPTTGPGDGAFFEVEVSRAAHPPTTTRLDLNREESGAWCVALTGSGLPVNLP